MEGASPQNFCGDTLVAGNWNAHTVFQTNSKEIKIKN